MIEHLSGIEHRVVSTSAPEDERQRELKALKSREKGEENPEEGEGGEKKLTNAEKIHQVELAAEKSEAAVAGVASEGKGQYLRLLERAKNLGIPLGVVEDVFRVNQEKGNPDGVQKQEGIVRKHSRLLKGIALAVGVGAPGVVEGALPSAIEAGSEMRAVKNMRLLSGEQVPKNPILEGAKMTPETRKDATRIGMNFPEEGGDSMEKVMGQLEKQTEALNQKMAEGENEGVVKTTEEKVERKQDEQRRVSFDVEKIDSGVVDGLAGIEGNLKKDIISFLGKNSAALPEDLARHNRNAIGLLVKTHGEGKVGNVLSLLKEISPLSSDAEKLSSYNFGFSHKGGEGTGSAYEKVDQQFQNLSILIENPDFATSLKKVVEAIRQSGDRMNFPIEDMKPAFVDLLANDPNELAAFLEFRAESKKSFLPVKFLKWLEENSPHEVDRERYGRLGYKPTEIMSLYKDWQKKENESDQSK